MHRDLKPENILLTKTKGFEIKIADFGFATRIPKGGYETLTCGSPYYMAPEIISGEKYRFEPDIWSIGVITYFLLCGNFPFNGKNSD